MASLLNLRVWIRAIDGHYILLPKSPQLSAYLLWKVLRKRDKIRALGVIITDSHAIPGKLGAVGMALAAYGFIPVFQTAKKDVFGDDLTLGASNIAEGLAAAAVTEMGEGAEQTPVAIIRNVNHIRFNRKAISLGRAKRYQHIAKAKDVYSPLFQTSDKA
jgi:F420-0:gamma-glutamyl ligase